MSVTWRTLETAPRRASRAGVRGMRPTSARSDAQASPRRPVNSPTTSSARVRTTISSERTGNRLPLVSVATVRIRWRARNTSWSRSGRRTSSSSRWRTRACGATTTRAPLRWIRQHSSMSSPWKVIAGSNPPSVRNRSARTSRQAEGSVNTSRTASCCSWSYSPGSVIGSTSPKRSSPSPTCWSTAGSSHDTSFGPTTPAFDRYSSSTSIRTQSGSSATSSWQKQEEPGVTLDQAQHLVGRRPEAGVGAEVADERLRQAGRDPRLERLGVARTGEEEEGVEVGVVLGRDRGERLVEPGLCGLGVDDDDRDDRRRRRGVGFHGGARLPAGPERSSSRICTFGSPRWRSGMSQRLTCDDVCSACNS